MGSSRTKLQIHHLALVTEGVENGSTFDMRSTILLSLVSVPPITT